MKKLFIIIICIITLVRAPLCLTAYAEPTVLYARAAVRNGYFFTQKDLSTSIFAVPYTYCVQVIRDDGDWYYAKYAEDSGVYRALYGYVQKDCFTPVYETPTVTYLYKALTVTYRADDGASSLPVLGEITVEAAFYGTYYAGATAYSYVLCQGSFGYIQGANDDYPLNTVSEPQPEAPEKDGDGQNVNSQLITAIILVALAAGALILLFVTTKKRGRIDGA